MNNGKFISTMIRMQFTPRWSEYAPRFEDNAASHSFRSAAFAVLIASIENRLLNHPVDALQLLARSLWGDLKNTGTGSIKHVTKKDRSVSELIRTVELEVSKEIVTYVSKSLQTPIYDYIVDAEDETYVGQLVGAIDSFDAMLFCHREALSDPRPFFRDKYEELHRSIHALELPSIQWLIQQFDLGQDMYEFLMHIMNLDTVKRWNGHYNLVPDNDATHSFRVASLALYNGLLEREKYGRKAIDLYRLVGKAVFHDLPEVICGDVVTNFKNNNRSIKQAFEHYEQHTAQEMVAKLPEFLHDPISDFMVASKSDDYEGLMVDIADKLDALIKANMEMGNNPHYMETFYQQLVKVQHQYENPCVIFFLAYILHDLTYEHFVR